MGPSDSAGAGDGITVDDEMFSAAYDELRRLARKIKRGPGSPTLNPTALVHEAYIKLAGARRFRAESPQHLKHTVVRAMKFLLVDAARRQAAAVRGGADATALHIPLERASITAAGVDPTEVLAISLALDDLTTRSRQAANAFELQFFGGLQVAEVAELIGVSEKKAQRLLRFARSALAVSLSAGVPMAPPGSHA